MAIADAQLEKFLQELQQDTYTSEVLESLVAWCIKVHDKELADPIATAEEMDGLRYVAYQLSALLSELVKPENDRHLLKVAQTAKARLIQYENEKIRDAELKVTLEEGLKKSRAVRNAAARSEDNHKPLIKGGKTGRPTSDRITVHGKDYYRRDFYGAEITTPKGHVYVISGIGHKSIKVDPQGGPTGQPPKWISRDADDQVLMFIIADRQLQPIN